MCARQVSLLKKLLLSISLENLVSAGGASQLNKKCGTAVGVGHQLRLYGCVQSESAYKKISWVYVGHVGLLQIEVSAGGASQLI